MIKVYILVVHELYISLPEDFTKYNQAQMNEKFKQTTTCCRFSSFCQTNLHKPMSMNNQSMGFPKKTVIT